MEILFQSLLACGDISHWNYETLDISSNLKAGENVIAAVVWNHGEWRAEFQIGR